MKTTIKSTPVRADLVQAVHDTLLRQYLNRGPRLTVDELAKASGVSRTTIHKMIKTGLMDFASPFPEKFFDGQRVQTKIPWEITKRALADYIWRLKACS